MRNYLPRVDWMVGTGLVVVHETRHYFEKLERGRRFMK